MTSGCFLDVGNEFVKRIGTSENVSANAPSTPVFSIRIDLNLDNHS